MKKSIILLALPALALTGCAKTITAAEAKEEAKKIAEHKMTDDEINAIKALTVSISSKDEQSGKYAGQEGSMSSEDEIVYEISADKSFIHTKVASKSETKEKDKDAVVNESYSEYWTYVKDNALYLVKHARSESEGKKSEEKLYFVLENDKVASEFEASLKKGLKTAVQYASGEGYTYIIDQSADEKAEEQGAKYEVKYTSSGEGNLSIKGKAEFKDYEYPVSPYKTIKATGSATIKYGWDKYLLSVAEMSMSLHAEEGEDAFDIKSEVNAGVKFKAKVSYPNLGDFEKTENPLAIL